MIARNDQTPIKVPRVCTSIGGLGAFSRDVVDAIRGLRDRKVIYDVPRVNLTQHCPLTPSIVQSGSDYLLYVSNGLSQDVTPAIDTGTVADTPAPYLTLTSPDVISYLWLVVEWEPNATLEGGDYFITSGGTHISSEFVESATRPTETEAEIDISTGAPTNGVYAFCWAVLDATTPPIRITAKRCGNHQFSFCPGSLRLMFD